MGLVRRPVSIFASMFAVAACSFDLPVVQPERFACFDETPEADGLLPCPDTHWCVQGECIPRLSCNTEDTGRPGCLTESTRCEPVVTPYSSAVQCERGIHTSTSARATSSACDCADGLHCVAFASGRDSTTYPLYLLPEGGPLAPGELGIDGEIEDWRMCLRACSSEANCPPNHTCRVAAVQNAEAMSSEERSRFTLGVCFPEQIVTSSVALEMQPQPDGCQSNAECARGMTNVGCVYSVETVADHPAVPAGSAWESAAIVGRCDGFAGGLAEVGIGCLKGSDCKTGLCVATRCAQPCNPLTPQRCPTARCAPRAVERNRGTRPPIDDVVYVCD